jgi:5-methylcytosine-specific restriction enzyme A
MARPFAGTSHLVAAIASQRASEKGRTYRRFTSATPEPAPEHAEYRSQTQGLYNSRGWGRLRAAQLRREPHCRCCASVNQFTPATVADHIQPHKGDRRLFFDPGNLQSLCKKCHDSTKASHERVDPHGADQFGNPLSPRRGW